MFRNPLSWYISTLLLLELIIKTHPTLHDSSHGFISKNPSYFDDELLHLNEELGLLKSSNNVPPKFQQKFEPSFLDLKERPKQQSRLDKTTLFYIGKNKSADTSASGSAERFPNSFFENRIRSASTLSHYRLRPIIGVRLPFNSTFAPLIYLHNYHLEPLQVVEIHSSDGEFNLELPSGEEEGSNYLWEIPPHQSKAIIRVHFLAGELKNYTADVRIRLNKPDLTLIVPLELEVTPETQLIHPKGYVDLGMGGNYDPPSEMKLCLLNPNKKYVRVHSVTTASKAVKIQYYNVRLPPAVDTQQPWDQCVDVATITVDWKTAYETKDFSGKIVVKFRNGRNKSEIPYHLTVLKGGLTFDPLTTTYFINDKAIDMSARAFKVKNEFEEYVRVSDVIFPTDAHSYFKVKILKPKILKPGEGSNLFFIELKNNVRLSDLHLQSHIIVKTNISDLRVPLLSYNGKLQVQLPFKSKDFSLDIGLLGFNAKKVVYFMVVNTNPVVLNLKRVHSSIPMTSAEIAGCGSGENKNVLYSSSFKHLSVCQKLKAGQYAVIKVSIDTTQVEGQVWGDIYVETQYEKLKVPVHFKIAPGKLEVGPDKLVFDQCFPGKICSHPLRIHSTFNDPMIIEDIISLPPDKRITSRHTGHIIARTSKIVGHLYFNPDMECHLDCYTGLQSDTSAQWLRQLALTKYVSDFDLHLVNVFYNRYLNLTSNGLKHWQNLTLRLDTSEVRGYIFQSKVKMCWPRLIHDQGFDDKVVINFPLTQVGNMTYRNITIRNPATFNVIVQLVFDRDYPGFQTLFGGMPPNLVVKSSPNDKYSSEGFFFHNYTKEKQQDFFLNNLELTHPLRESIPVLLSPGQSYTFPVGFFAEDTDFHSAILLLRNNLTIMEVVRLNAKGVQPMFKFGNRKPGSLQPLTFEMTERHFADCEKRKFPGDPNFTVKRTFTARNIGDVTLYINSFYINNYHCEGYGFKVLDCEPFVLHPNQTKKIDIAFTPDLTLSKVSRTLILATSLNIPVNYTLYTTIPALYLNICSDAISRPVWEVYLSFLTVTAMTLLVIVILCLAAIDAERIRRQAIGSFIFPSTSTIQPVLDLRLVGQQTREEIQSPKVVEKKEESAEKEEEVEIKPKPELERYTVLVPTTGTRVRKRLGHRISDEAPLIQNDASDIQIEEKVDKKKEKHHHQVKLKEVTTEDKEKNKEVNKKTCNNINNNNKKHNTKNNTPVPAYEEETSSTATDSSGSLNEDPEKENNQRNTAKVCSKTNTKRDTCKSTSVIESNLNNSADFKYVNFNNQSNKLRQQKSAEKKLKSNEKQKRDAKEYETANQKTNNEHHNQNAGKHHVHQREGKKRERVGKERKEKGFHRKLSDKMKQIERLTNAEQIEKPSKNSCFSIPLPTPTTTNSIWGESRAKFSDVVARNDSSSASSSFSNTITCPVGRTTTAVSKPTMYVEPYKQSPLAELGPIGSRRTDNRRSSAETQENNRRATIDLNGLSILGNGLDNERTNSFFSDGIRLDNVGRENGYINANAWNPHESFGNVLDTAGFPSTDANTIMEEEGIDEESDPWNQNLLNTSSYWDSYNPLLGDTALLNDNSSLLDKNSLLDENPLLGETSKEVVSSASNVYLWGSSPVWQPWAPDGTSIASRTPTRTPPSFDEFLQRKEESPQPQPRESYSPFNTSPLWNQHQQTNPWNYSQGQ